MASETEPLRVDNSEHMRSPHASGVLRRLVFSNLILVLLLGLIPKGISGHVTRLVPITDVVVLQKITAAFALLPLNTGGFRQHPNVKGKQLFVPLRLQAALLGVPSRAAIAARDRPFP